MLRTTSLLTLTAAFALSASLAGACPYSKNQQTTEADKPAMSTVADAKIRAAIATHDGKTRPTAPAEKPAQN